eukprot:1142194-Pelagomonas_calceolata.AAC.5
MRHVGAAAPLTCPIYPATGSETPAVRGACCLPAAWAQNPSVHGDAGLPLPTCALHPPASPPPTPHPLQCPAVTVEEGVQLQWQQQKGAGRRCCHTSWQLQTAGTGVGLSHRPAQACVLLLWKFCVWHHAAAPAAPALPRLHSHSHRQRLQS